MSDQNPSDQKPNLEPVQESPDQSDNKPSVYSISEDLNSEKPDYKEKYELL